MIRDVSDWSLNRESPGFTFVLQEVLLRIYMRVTGRFEQSWEPIGTYLQVRPRSDRWSRVDQLGTRALTVTRLAKRVLHLCRTRFAALFVRRHQPMQPLLAQLSST